MVNTYQYLFKYFIVKLLSLFKAIFDVKVVLAVIPEKPPVFHRAQGSNVISPYL